MKLPFAVTLIAIFGILGLTIWKQRADIAGLRKELAVAERTLSAYKTREVIEDEVRKAPSLLDRVLGSGWVFPEAP